MKRLGILISGRGSNMESLIKAARDGRIRNAEAALVISNAGSAAGLRKAADLNVETLTIDHRGASREEHDRRVYAALAAHQVDLVCLAGYMRLLSPWFTRELEGSVLNIHPSLLPAFPGLDAQQQALEHGVRFTGCTVHMVDEHLDHGPIVAQSVVPVLDEDTVESLSTRILAEEHKLYPQAVDFVLNRRFRIQGRRVCALEGE